MERLGEEPVREPAAASTEIDSLCHICRRNGSAAGTGDVVMARFTRWFMRNIDC